MPEEGIWIIDSDTEDRVWLPYSEIPDEAKLSIFKPIGGFIYPMTQFLQLELPKVPFYIQDWLPKRGRCMVYAPAKAGKSFLTYQVGRCIGTGEDFLGMPTTQGTVLLIQGELGAEIVQDRTRRINCAYPNMFIGTNFSLKIDTDQGFRILDQAMNAVKPDVLILDPLYKLISGDENDASAMRLVVDNLDNLLEVYNCALFVIHHSGKDINKGARGSSVLEDWVDSYLQMKRISKEGEPLKVKITPQLLRHAELSPEPITALMENFEFHQVSVDPTVKEKVKALILSNYNVGGSSTTRKEILGKEIGSNTSVQEALNTLCDERVIERVARGEYYWISGE